MGAPEFALPSLSVLVEAGHEILAVYSQPPRPAGRGKKMRPTPVAARAKELGLEVRTPVSLKASDAQSALTALQADALIVVAYGLLLPQAALEATRLGAFNVHPSLLPRWRGAAPIQRAIMAGDSETGVAVMRMTEGLDEGPVLAVERAEIGPMETTASLHDRLARLGAALLRRVLPEIAAGWALETPQAEIGVEYARKIDKAETRIDWRLPPGPLDYLIRGLSPFPGAWFEWDGERVKALLSRIEPSSIGEYMAGEHMAGEALDDALLIACGDSPQNLALRILRVQRAGRAPVSATEFLHSRPIPAGAKLD